MFWFCYKQSSGFRIISVFFFIYIDETYFFLSLILPDDQLNNRLISLTAARSLARSPVFITFISAYLLILFLIIIDYCLY